MNEQVLPDTDIDKKEIDAAKWLITSLLLLLKTYGLYSERHPFCEKMLKEFHTKLLSFLEDYDSLVLTIEKRRLLYEGEEVLSGPANEEAVRGTSRESAPLDIATLIAAALCAVCISMPKPNQADSRIR